MTIPSPSTSKYDMIPKLMITTHGKWNVLKNSDKGHPIFKLPYNVRIMYATGMGVVNYLDQRRPNRINIEYSTKKKSGMLKLKNFKKDLKSLDLYGCCDELACKDNRRNVAPIINEHMEDEENSDSSVREMATEFLDHTDEPYRITSKKKGVTMPLKTYEITSNEFVIKNGVAQLNSEKVYDNRVLLYIPGKDPIDILYNWHIGNPEGKPYIAAKLRRKEISITFKDILLLVKNKCAELGIHNYRP